jgi:hypothetical protein
MQRQTIEQMRARFLQRLLFPSPRPGQPAAVPRPELLEVRRQIEQLLRIDRLREQKELLEVFMEKLLREKSDDLRQRLTDRNPTVRFLTIQAIARRRLPLEKALIERLIDRDRTVAQAARAALVRLGRGVDFGPTAKATRTQRHQAVQRWTDWLALQEKTKLPASQDRLTGIAQAEVLPPPCVERETVPARAHSAASTRILR